MIENFLLDPEAIWEALQSVIEKTGWSSVDQVERALDELLDNSEQREIERRTVAGLGIATYRPQAPVAGISTSVTAFIAQTQQQFSLESVETLKRQSQAIVARLKEDRKRRELFHGKDLINDLFKLYLHKTGMPKGVFLFETARHARRRKSVTQFFDQFIETLERV